MNHFLKEKKDIEEWLVAQGVKNYELMADDKCGWVVNVDDTVMLAHKKITHIPVQFGEVSRSFFCGGNQLTSLAGCPKKVSGSFDCSDNQLSSLEFCPQWVDGSFNCIYNKIDTLEFLPQHVGTMFVCRENLLWTDIRKIPPFSEIVRMHLDIVNMKKEKSELTQQIEANAFESHKSYKI